jgi:hypothetical protein
MTGLLVALPWRPERPVTHAAMLGVWKASWNDSGCEITFCKNGDWFFRFCPGDQLWQGKWWVARDTLWIRECAQEPCAEGHTWLYHFHADGHHLSGERVQEPGDFPPFEVTLVLKRKKGPG